VVVEKCEAEKAMLHEERKEMQGAESHAMKMMRNLT
jgi:hypothetical protein